ncbi:7TM domain-containing protein [Geodermatophilus sp. DSM 44513]|uniref:7TM domain-containing protein n=1 Tax=Geodermatophilus sp. DSM 44513 TaxID=1528104 RepID=UPI001278A1CA|nr:7TM domain-containing protein [Geodermatophilus sp. DSM 44513]WNV76025.1 7TM domain-containing protein [Geodermatophilus sp. DSM 44513]
MSTPPHTEPALGDDLPPSRPGATARPGGAHPAPRIPAVGRVLLAVAALALLIGAVALSPRTDVARSPEAVIGTQELVRITGPNGESVEAMARIDTGASSSSIDDDIAEDLGYDLDDAETVTVASSLGEEERPVVVGGLQLAGDAAAARFTVTDRSERTTPVLIGRADLRGLQVAVGQRMLTTPGDDTAPTALRALLSEGPALGPQSLLAVLPMAALVIVLLRVVVGLSTLGTFSPVLLAFGYTQAGLTTGLLLTGLMLTLGFAAQPLLRRFRLPRVARLSVLIGLVAMLLVGVQTALGLTGVADSWGAALPVVVTAAIIERLWETWDLDGPRPALVDCLNTLVVAVLVTLLILAPVTRLLTESAPLAFSAACVVAAGLAGTYRGLRLVELIRFSPLTRRTEALR